MVRHVLIALAMAGLVASCRFSPQIADGTIRCGADASCPPGFACAADGYCREGASPSPDLGVEDLAGAADLASADLAGADLGSEDLSTAPDLACVKATCAGNACGKMLDGCGGVLDCGTKLCGSGKSCGAKMPNQCGPGSCTPVANCGAAGKNCGLISNGCDDVLDCGGCSAGTCGGGGVANVCG